MFVRIMIPVDSLNDLEVNEDIKIFSSMKSFFLLHSLKLDSH